MVAAVWSLNLKLNEWMNMPINTSPSSSPKAITEQPNISEASLYSLRVTHSSNFNMSSCGNCDCPDKTNCPKKGNAYGVVIVEARTFDDVVEVAACGENDGKCKCGTNCTCADCGCGK